MKKKRNNLPTSGANRGEGILGKESPGGNRRKVLGTILVISIIGIIIGVSYAWWSHTAYQSGINKIESDCLKLSITDKTPAITLEKAYPLTDKEAESLEEYTFTIENICTLNVVYDVNLEVMEVANQLGDEWLDIDFNKTGKKRLDSFQSATPTYNQKDAKDYNPKDYTAGNAYGLTSGTLNAGEKVSYSLKLWIDERAEVTDPVMNKTWIGKISVNASLNQVASWIFSDYIIEQSNRANSGITKVEHEATEQTPALTDYRYVGKNPNNYVYFGCDNNCTEDNLYRIIGVIPTQSSETGPYEPRVKLIKADYYTEEESGYLENNLSGYQYTSKGKGYKWNSTANNKWEESTLQEKVLNGIYWKSLGKYQKYIDQAKWYLGAPNYVGHTVEEFYTLERSNTQGKSGGLTSYINHIGLMYASDYGYSIKKEIWMNSNTLGDNRSLYKDNAWLYNLENKYYEWTITPESTLSDSNGVSVWYLLFDGATYPMTVSYETHKLGIRPTFYLKAEVLYAGGDGTTNNPYRIFTN